MNWFEWLFGRRKYAIVNRDGDWKVRRVYDCESGMYIRDVLFGVILLNEDGTCSGCCLYNSWKPFKGFTPDERFGKYAPIILHPKESA